MRFRSGTTKFLPLFAIFLLFISSCSDDPVELPVLSDNQLVSNVSSEVIQEWYHLYLRVERFQEDFRPNPTSRALGYIGMAIYEAALPGMPAFSSVSHILQGYRTPRPLPNNTYYWSENIAGPAYWEAVINHTFLLTFQHFIHSMTSDQEAEIFRLYFSQIDRLGEELTNEDFQNAASHAERVAQAVIQYAQSDAEAEAQLLDVEPADYIPPSGVGYWQPTGPDFRNACHPYWYRTRKFVTPENSISFVDPAPYSEDPQSRFYQEAKEVNDVVAQLTEEERWIAEFWSDDIVGLTFSPPARQVAIANQLIAIENANMEEAIHLYLRLGWALNDAAIVCWEGKYKYNLERPIDYIRRVINPQFKTILGEAEGVPSQNPNFPAYPSGHSTFAAAGASVFKYFFKNQEFTDRCHEDRTAFNGTPRTFRNFDEMARENAYSRIPLGVHFRMDCDEGLRIGYEVGRFVSEISLQR